jgi:predicted cupin superfamily sugar epimerase
VTRDANYWIETLALFPHPEGGHYRETYRSEGSIPASSATGDHPAGRSFSTAIYYLLRWGEVSRFHRLRSDEVFHHYRGSALLLHVIEPDGVYRALPLGGDPERGQALQVVVRAGGWLGAAVETPGSFSLVGCTVAPGFDFADFELAERARLLEQYPRHRDVIERLT